MDAILNIISQLLFGENKKNIISSIIILIFILIFTFLIKELFIGSSETETQVNTLKVLIDLDKENIPNQKLLAIKDQLISKLERSIIIRDSFIKSDIRLNIFEQFYNNILKGISAAIIPFIILLSSFFAKQKSIAIKIFSFLFIILILLISLLIGIYIPTLYHELINAFIYILLEGFLLFLLYKKMVKKHS